MNNLIISAEATSDLPQEILDKYNIKVTDVNYFVDDKPYNSKTNHMSEQDFYGSMRNGSDTKTTQVNQNEAFEHLKALMDTGKDVLHIGFSSGLSGTFNNFKLAAEELNKTYQNKCYVVDSLCASAGQGLLVMLVCKKAQKENLSAQQLAQYAEEVKLRINHIFTVDDLKYLAKGGRISKASAKIANILRIKPILKMDNEGKLVVTNKVFGRKLAINKLFDKMKTNYDPYFGDILICEADCKTDADYLAQLIKNNFGIAPIIVPLDYFIGSHSGPGTISVFYVGDKR